MRRTGGAFERTPVLLFPPSMWCGARDQFLGPELGGSDSVPENMTSHLSQIWDATTTTYNNNMNCFRIAAVRSSRVYEIG